MSFTVFLSAVSSFCTIVLACVAGLKFLHESRHNRQAWKQSGVIISGTAAAMFFIILVGLLITHPAIAVNNQTGISLPGYPAPTEANNTTVVVITPTATPAPSLKKLVFDKKLVCLNACYDNLVVVLNNVVIDQSHNTMTWNFTITNNGSSVCNSMNGNMHLEDVNGQVIYPSGGTLGGFNSINTNQTLQENLIFSFIPSSGTTYTLHTLMSCVGPGDEYQIETFTF